MSVSGMGEEGWREERSCREEGTVGILLLLLLVVVVVRRVVSSVICDCSLEMAAVREA